ncbi:pyridoxal-phosphate dependent enzyme [Draconibacterium sp. IB214405]|uniref:pyridoxal-phosphate dependent enzyme n=1 Tax=Draconibacterium sp. IB214405 TaxID=3097352 RepID=UPI002A144DDE|nr:pyridoxal-phosphate dependent enzyme [Draconibacterium sp. IB214405]MDX8341334.1 pyridoxal-phosphate dependent enzyme [Draconibacterium sp. IB214405]
MDIPIYTDIVKAHEIVQKYAHRTPVLTSESINNIVGAELFFKCENLQKVGAFKFRGACNAVFSLSEEDAAKGVATHSSGNHAAALALAARMRGIDAHIVMPENSPEIKKKAVAGYGAKITFCKPTLQARESTLAKVVEETGATEIHPYNNFNVIAGQGTAAKELIEDKGEFDVIMAPVGGGGLLSGTAISTKHLLPACKVIAAEPAGADDAYRSFRSKKFVPSENPKTIADGLLTSLGERNFAIILDKVDDIVTVSEESIVEAMRMIWERMKIITEPSSAVPLAAILEKKVDVQGKKVGIILSGGNLDLGKLPF